MRHTLFSLVLVAASGAAFGACPEFLNHDLRKLHSNENINLCERHSDKPLLIVNTASHCGFTKQFSGLEALHQKYRDRGFEVVGFASDSFKQESDTEEGAAEVCYVNYGVTFTMIAPSPVRGDDANPVFQHLNQAKSAPMWNFNKYLVDRQGNVIEKYGSMTRPEDEDLAAAIEALL